MGRVVRLINREVAVHGPVGASLFIWCRFDTRNKNIFQHLSSPSKKLATTSEILTIISAYFQKKCQNDTRIEPRILNSEVTDARIFRM